MNKIIFAFAAILFFSSVKSQSVQLSMGYQPMHQYDMTIDQTIKTAVDLDSSSAEMKSKMESGGMKNRLNNNQKTHMVTQVITGKLDGQSHKMPVTMTIISTDSMTAKALKPGVKFIGSAGQNEIPVLDSVSGMDVNASQKSVLLKVMASMSQIKLPNKNLNVGDSDTTHSPISLPIGMTNLNMDYKTIYTLKSVSGQKAMFDLKSDFGMTVDVKETPVTGGGGGGGSMIYDLDKKYPTETNQVYTIKMRMAKDKLIMHFNITTEMMVTTKIKSL